MSYLILFTDKSQIMCLIREKYRRLPAPGCNNCKRHVYCTFDTHNFSADVFLNVESQCNALTRKTSKVAPVIAC